jgi:hypothetical protein
MSKKNIVLYLIIVPIGNEAYKSIFLLMKSARNNFIFFYVFYLIIRPTDYVFHESPNFGKIAILKL